MPILGVCGIMPLRIYQWVLSTCNCITRAACCLLRVRFLHSTPHKSADDRPFTWHNAATIIARGCTRTMAIETPEWVKHAVFYQIFPDRFARSPRTQQPRGMQFKPWGSPPEEQGY